MSPSFRPLQLPQSQPSSPSSQPPSPSSQPPSPSFQPESPTWALLQLLPPSPSPSPLPLSPKSTLPLSPKSTLSPKSPLSQPSSPSSQPHSPERPKRPFRQTPSVPVEVMKKILSHLPVSTLACFRAVTTTFYYTIRCLPPTLPFPQDPFFFLFYSWPNRGYMVYHPFRDRWLFHSAPRFPTASSGSHFLMTCESLYKPGLDCIADSVTTFNVFNPFSGATTAVPLPIRSLQRYHGSALIFNDNSSTFKIVATSIQPQVFETYNSETGSWTACCNPPYPLDEHVNAVLLDGMLYVLSREPPRLLRVNLEAGIVSEVESELPVSRCRHVMVFEGRLFIVGWAPRLLNGSNVIRIEVWEFDERPLVPWRLANCMPNYISEEFCRGSAVPYFRVCSWGRTICFYHCLSDCVLMLDVVIGTWTMATACWMPRGQRNVWVGCAVEPNANVLG